jgi:hypothetical protein
MVAGCGCRVVPGQLLQEAKLAARISLAGPFADVAELLEHLPLAGGGSLVVAGQALHGAQIAERNGLAEPVTNVLWGSNTRSWR